MQAPVRPAELQLSFDMGWRDMCPHSAIGTLTRWGWQKAQAESAEAHDTPVRDAAAS